MNKLAYSYLRFSTPEQAGGDSDRRQLDLARTYAARHGLVLDAGLSFRNLGMSAFHGRTVRKGALRAFLDAVELGLVPRGSHLLVESLDRLSRDRVLLAQSLFLRIVEAGITIVTLIDDRGYSAESLNRSPMDLIVSLVGMMRANKESVTKSARLRAVWARKRAELGTTPATGRCPGWLRLDKGTGRFVEREREANVLAKARSLSVIADVEAEEQALLEERRCMRPGTTGWLDVTLRARLDHLRAMALIEPLDPPAVNAALKSVLTQVVVDWPRSVLVLTWRHGAAARSASR